MQDAPSSSDVTLPVTPSLVTDCPKFLNPEPLPQKRDILYGRLHRNNLEEEVSYKCK